MKTKKIKIVCTYIHICPCTVTVCATVHVFTHVHAHDCTVHITNDNSINQKFDNIIHLVALSYHLFYVLCS